MSTSPETYKVKYALNAWIIEGPGGPFEMHPLDKEEAESECRYLNIAYATGVVDGWAKGADAIPFIELTSFHSNGPVLVNPSEIACAETMRENDGDKLGPRTKIIYRSGAGTVLVQETASVIRERIMAMRAHP